MALDGKQLCASKGEDDLVCVCVCVCVCVSEAWRRQGSGPHFAQDKNERYCVRNKKTGRVEAIGKDREMENRKNAHQVCVHQNEAEQASNTDMKHH